jgi:DNA replication protein DnaC
VAGSTAGIIESVTACPFGPHPAWGQPVRPSHFHRGCDTPCLVGPAGTGKTHHLIGLGRAAVTAGYKVRYFTAIELVEHLYRAVADNTVGRAIEAVCRNDLIIIDEIGFAPLDHTGCQLLFRLVAAGYERRSIAIGSHSPFEQWGRFLPDQPTAVSLLDRLCHHAHIITTTGDSYRLTHRTTRKEA